MAQFENGDSFLSIRTLLNSSGIRKNNFEAARDPLNTDDNTSGYERGSQWLNTATGEMFYAQDVTTSSSIWASMAAVAVPDRQLLSWNEGNQSLTISDGNTVELTATLDNLTDVSVASPADQEVLYYNSAQQSWLSAKHVGLVTDDVVLTVSSNVELAAAEAWIAERRLSVTMVDSFDGAHSPEITVLVEPGTYTLNNTWSIENMTTTVNLQGSGENNTIITFGDLVISNSKVNIDNITIDGSVLLIDDAEMRSSTNNSAVFTGEIDLTNSRWYDNGGNVSTANIVASTGSFIDIAAVLNSTTLQLSDLSRMMARSTITVQDITVSNGSELITNDEIGVTDLVIRDGSTVRSGWDVICADGVTLIRNGHLFVENLLSAIWLELSEQSSIFVTDDLLISDYTDVIEKSSITVDSNGGESELGDVFITDSSIFIEEDVLANSIDAVNSNLFIENTLDVSGSVTLSKTTLTVNDDVIIAGDLDMSYSTLYADWDTSITGLLIAQTSSAIKINGNLDAVGLEITDSELYATGSLSAFTGNLLGNLAAILRNSTLHLTNGADINGKLQMDFSQAHIGHNEQQTAENKLVWHLKEGKKYN